MTITTREEFGSLLNELGLNGFGVEIGVGSAKYSEVLLSTTKLAKIFFIDPWKEYPKSEYDDVTNSNQKTQDQRYAITVKKLEKYGDRAVVIRKDSEESLTDFPDTSFDFIHIDANHSYEHSKRDVNNWYPKLKVNGIFSGHDYFDGRSRTGIYGVKSAVDEFCKEHKVIPIILQKGLTWYFVKTN